MNNPFDLETAIATWRQFHTHRRVFLRDDLDELEQHLRDHTAHLIAQGLDEEAAFQQAVQALGDLEGGVEEYGKVYWGKMRRQHGLVNEFIWRGSMLSNHLKMALRQFKTKKGYALLNILGLTLGMACCLLLFQYVAYETSFDHFNAKKDRIYRAGFALTQNGSVQRIRGATGFNLGPTMAEALPEIVQYVRLQPNYGSAVLSYTEGEDSRTFKEEGVVYADSTFLRLFDYPLVHGDRLHALTEPHTMLVSASMARKYFGEADPLGRTIDVTGWVRGSYTVVGVFEDVPPTSHLRFDILLPMQDLLDLQRFSDPERGWDRLSFATYFEVEPHAEVATLERKITEVYLQHRRELLAATNTRVAAHLQPLLDIHLNAEITGPVAVSGSRKTVYFFLVIGLITLFIALVNYVNLATARALDRAKEVGVRKVVGAHQGQLITQFMTESVLMNGVALVLAVGLSLALRPALNQVAAVQLSGVMWLNRPFWLVVLGLFAVGALLAGLYPSLILSSFKPATVLKGAVGTLASRATFRKMLVVIQFTASIVLLVGTAVVYAQLTYMREMDMGFSMDQVLVVERPRVRGDVAQWAAEMTTLKNELRTLPAVGNVGLSSTTPGGGFDWYSPVFKTTDDPSEGKPARATEIDHDFLNVYGLEVVAGEPFREGLPLSDSEDARVLVNETLVRRVGFASNEAAVGQQVRVGRGGAYIIHGVVSDFNWSSAHLYAEAVLLLYETRYGDISMTVRPDRLPETLAAIQQIYETRFPGNPFVYHFADELFDAQYQADKRFATLFAVFAGLAIFIACLGLFGLVSFATARRTKEIGIRKVLGASVGGLVGLLSKDFLKLVGLAFLVAAPIAHLAMQRWLETFAYRIELSGWIFLLAGLLTLAIALLTVSYQSLKAALADPVQSLRYE